MSGALIVTGTDTGVGKTVFAAGLAVALGGYYWKAVQSGTDGTDSDTAVRIAGLPPNRILPEGYRLKTPASPHLAARIEGIEISGIGDDESRLVESTYQILFAKGIDGGLASDGAVRLGEQSGRHMDHGAAALEQRGSEAGYVAYAPPSQCQDRGISSGIAVGKGGQETMQLVPVLGRFAFGEEDWVGSKFLRKPGAMQREYFRLGLPA